jgi:transposase-like protein
MPKGQRKQYTPEFKFKLVQESLKNENMTTVARKYSVNFTLLAKWKSHFLEHGKHVFETNPDNEKEDLKKTIAKLEQIVGKKEIELNLLKNFSDFYESRNTM